MSAAPAPHANRLLVPVLALSAGLSAASLTLISPSLPAIEHDLGLQAGVIGQMQALYLLGLALPQLFFGIVSDRIGRRRPLLIGLLCFLSGSLICAQAEGLGMLLAGRLLQAIGASASLVLTRAILRETSNGGDRAASMLGYVTVAMMVVPMIAPLVGGILQGHFGWRSNFYLLTVFAALLFASVAWVVPGVSSLPAGGVRVSFGLYRRILSSRTFQAFTIQTTLASAANQIIFNCSPFVAENAFGAAPKEYGSWMTLSAGGYMIGNFMSGQLSVRLGAARVLGFGTAALALWSLILLGVFASGSMTMAILFLLAGVLGICHGLVMPNALAGLTGAVPGLYGSAAGLGGMIQMFGGAVAVLVVLPLVQAYGLSALVGALACLSLLAFCAFHTMRTG